MVEHEQTDSGTGELVDGNVEVLLSLEINGNVSGSRDEEISAVVNISESVSSDNDGFGPILDQSWNVLDENGFSEHGSVEVVSDGSVGALPHLLQFEFLNSSLIGGDGGALDSHLALLDGSGGIEGHLVIGLVSVLDTEIEVVDLEVEERMDEIVLDELPEDPGHLVTVMLSDSALHLDLLGSEAVAEHAAGGDSEAP
jgi:hypothetical protein